MLIIIITSLHLLFDIYGFMNNINKIFNAYCSDPAILNTKDYKWTQDFRNNYQQILTEYNNYTNTHFIPYYYQLNKDVSTPDYKHKWKALYLRAFNVDTNLSTYFPLTMNLIKNIPCTLAYFSILEPGAVLRQHVGIYKGVIRYHLGLKIPKEYKKCHLDIDKKRLYWLEGEDLMFDDMFLHSAENRSDEERIILFLDIKRDFENIFLNVINSSLLYFIPSNDALTKTIENINDFWI